MKTIVADFEKQMADKSIDAATGPSVLLDSAIESVSGGGCGDGQGWIKTASGVSWPLNGGTE